MAVQPMAEVGIDITGNTPRRLDRELVEGNDIVVSMGCGDACPYVPGTRYDDWKLTDPAGQPVEVVREVRDEIRVRVETLLAQLLPAGA
jgi:arsenate reductase